MNKKLLKKILLRFSIAGELFRTLWKYKLWWGVPVIFLILLLTVLLVAAGHTGVSAFIYPIF
jgi:hypothetical protein